MAERQHAPSMSFPTQPPHRPGSDVRDGEVATTSKRQGERGRVATYSIAACDLEAGQWGVATESKFLAVGSVVPWAEPQVGAIATQAYANPRYGPEGLELLRSGASAEEAVAALTAADEGRAQRQVGIVDAKGGS